MPTAAGTLSAHLMGQKRVGAGEQPGSHSLQCIRPKASGLLGQFPQGQVKRRCVHQTLCKVSRASLLLIHNNPKIGMLIFAFL